MTDAFAIATDIRLLVDGLNQRLQEAQDAGLTVYLGVLFRDAVIGNLGAVNRLRVDEISRQELL